MTPSRRFLCHLLMILSGTASLIYQVVWTRVLQYNFGITDLAVATVVAVFMGGLALGAFIGGRLAKRLRRPILVYGLLEAGIAIYALAITPVLYNLDFVYGIVGVDAGAGTLTLIRFTAAAVLMLVPTVCMGATLPVITRPLVTYAKAGEGVGLLYFVNTLGAVIGSALAGFLLIRFWGLQASLYTGVVLGILVCGAAALVQQGMDDLDPGVKRAESESLPPFAAVGRMLSAQQGFRIILAFSALAGFIALVNEIVWTRILVLLLDGTVYGFSALLAAFLLGIALGSLFIAPFIDRSRDLWGLFAKVQILAGVGCTLTIILIPLIPGLISASLSEGTSVQAGFALKVLLVFLAILVPCLFFGAAFPIAVTIASRYQAAMAQAKGSQRVGMAGSVGTVYAANTLGSIFGALSGGMLLLPMTKDLNTILVLMVFLSLFLAAVAGGISAMTRFGQARLRSGARRDQGYKSALLKGGGLVLLPFLLFTTVVGAKCNVDIFRLVCTRYAVEDYDRSLGFRVDRAAKTVDQIVWKGQGKSTVVTVHRLDDGGLRLRNNGLNESYHGTSDPRFAEVIFYLAALPYMLHPNPKTALLIGLGGGGTAESLIRTGLDKITVVELEEQVVKASRYMYRTLTGKKEHPLDDKRVTLRVDDGRNALLRSARAKPGQFDLVVSQPSHAWLAGVASLYTLDHFRIVRKSLRRGGVFCQWINLFRMDETGLRSLLSAFTKAFPRTHFWHVDTNSLLLIGGDEQLRLDPAVVRRHLQEKKLGEHARLFSIDVFSVFRGYLFGRAEALTIAGNARPNTDRYPIIEMRLPWISHAATTKIVELLKRKGLRRGIRPGDLHRGEGYAKFLRDLAEDLIGEYESQRLSAYRVGAFVDAAAKRLGREGAMLRGRLARVRGEYLEALAHYAIGAQAGLKEAQVQRGELLLLLRRYADAARECAAAYRGTKRAAMRLCEAQAHFRRGRYAEARAVLEAMVKKGEEVSAPGAKKLLGLIDFLGGRYARATKLLAEYVSGDNEDDEAPYVLGLLKVGQGEHAAAKKYFAQALAAAKARAAQASDVGKRFAKAGAQVGAVVEFQRALSWRRELADTYQWMAKALRRWGRYAELTDLLNRFEQANASSSASFRPDFDRRASIGQRIGAILNRHHGALAGE